MAKRTHSRSTKPCRNALPRISQASAHQGGRRRLPRFAPVKLRHGERRRGAEPEVGALLVRDRVLGIGGIWSVIARWKERQQELKLGLGFVPEDSMA